MIGLRAGNFSPILFLLCRVSVVRPAGRTRGNPLGLRERIQYVPTCYAHCLDMIRYLYFVVMLACRAHDTFY